MSNSEYPGLVVERDGKVMIIRFNAPKRKNALTLKMYRGLTDNLKEAATNPDITVVALTGTGGFYSSGNDFGELLNPQRNTESPTSGSHVKDLVDLLIDFPKILIAVVNGPAVGIAVTTLALMDAVYAVDNAWLLCPFTKIGLCPEACSSVLFPAIMGPIKAAEILLFNKKLTTVEACQLGLISEVYPESTFNSIVWGKIKEFSELPPLSLVEGKKLCRDHNRHLLHEANRKETDCLNSLAGTEQTVTAMVNWFSRKSKL